MRYSVWNGSRYDYYDAPGSLDDGVFAPKPKMRSYSRIGLSPDEAARPLPATARLVGHGHQAQGLIASRKVGVLGAFPDLTSSSLLVIGTVIAVTCLILTSKKK